jgi:hypothetical protein
MSKSQLLVEFADTVISLKSNNSIISANTDDNNNGKRKIKEKESSDGINYPIITVLPYSIMVMNSENGSLLHKYELPQKTNKKQCTILNCSYISEAKSFLLIMSDSSLIRIPEINVISNKLSSSSSLSEISTHEKITWPIQPTNIYNLGNRGIIITCEKGFISHFFLDSESSLPNAPSKPNSKLIKSFDDKYISLSSNISCGNSIHFTDLKTSKNKDKIISTTWKNITKRTTNDTIWLSEDDAIISKIPLNIELKEEIVSVCCNSNSHSFTIILSNSESLSLESSSSKSKKSKAVTNTTNNSSKGKLLKIDLNGDIIMERILSYKPISISYINEMIYLTHTTGIVVWDIRYGAQVFEMASINTLTQGVHRSLVMQSGNNNVSLITCNKAIKNNSSSLYRLQISIPFEQTKSSLCNVIDFLKNNKSNENKDINDKGKVLSSLSGNLKRKLIQAQKKIEIHNKEEEERNALLDLEISNEVVQESEKKKYIKKSPFYLDIPIDASQAFLSRLEEVGTNGDLQASDWDTVKLLLLSRTLSLSGNPSLIEQAMKSNRIDVIIQIARYVPDLSETGAVNLLLYSATLSDSILDRLSIGNGTLQWGKATSSLVAEEPKGKKTKKNSKVVVVEQKEKDSSIYLASKKILPVRAMVESLLLRKGGYSSVVLSDAVSKISAQVATVLLRVFSHFVKGLCVSLPNNYESSTGLPFVLGDIRDEQVRRAVSWTEAILDAHFSSIAMNAMLHVPSRKALHDTMQAVNNADDAAQLVESVLGIVTHMQRVIKAGGEVVNTTTALYQVELLKL